MSNIRTLLIKACLVVAAVVAVEPRVKSLAWSLLHEVALGSC